MKSGHGRESARNEVSPISLFRHRFIYTRVRDYKKSDEVAETALASFPNAPSYFRARAVVNSLRRGDLKQAREQIARSEKLLRLRELWPRSKYVRVRA